MKKVFAFLSTLLLTIAFVGIFAFSKPVSASYKILEDPTLEDDEIPMYIMSSIYTTFPNYYDNDAKADDKWGGPARMYPWNETRLRVAQVDDNGQPTGKYYAVYFAGALKHEENGKQVIGAGQNILFWNIDANGNVITEKQSNGKSYYPGQASDPSLSHARRNISGQDIEVDPTLSEYNLAGEGTNYYNRSIVFDGEGRIIRAVGLDGIYTSGDGDYKMAPEYCYVDGVVTKMDENTECDKELAAKVDPETGEPVLDENGEPVMEETGELNIIYGRFVYEYFTEKPENVNEVPYLSQGWDPDLWDYCYEEGDGWLCIAFVDNANNAAHKIKGAQIDAYVNTLLAQGKTQEEAEALASGKVRECVRLFRIPADGIVFDYGYLDRGTSNDEFFNDTVIKGYKYGRTTITAEQRTYNFSVTGLYFKDKVIDGASYQLLNNQNVVEVMQGSVINPADQIVYDGIMRYWGTPNDLTSYTASAEALEFYISEAANGAGAITMVQPSTGYTTFADMANDFMADFNAFLAKKNGYTLQEDGSYAKVAEDGTVTPYTPLATPTLPAGATADEAKAAIGGTGGVWYSTVNYNLCSTTDGADTFVENEEMWAKWSWLFEYMNLSLDKVASGINLNTRVVASPGNWTYTMWCFLAEAPLVGGWPSSKVDWSNGLAREWLDERTNLEKWEQYQIDASMSAPNDNWVVTYKVVNADTGVSSELTIKYVVVDSYTPIIKVDSNKLFYQPKKVSDLVSCDPIDPYQIVTAYDAQYNGVNILGNDISQNVEFETELDFANPKEGKWPVVATIYNNARTKKAVAKFVVQIADITAPNVTTRKVVIQQGDDFDARDGIVLAVDNVDGDLTKQSYAWWEETSKPVDTTKINNGKDATYTVKVTVYDKSGNEKAVSYTLVVVADKFNDQAKANLEAIAEQVDELSGTLLDIVDAQADLNDMISDLQAEIAELAGLKAQVETLNAAVAELAGLKAQIEALGEEIEGLQAGLGSLTEDVAELAAVKAQIEALEAAVAELNGEVGSVKEEVVSLKGEVSAVKGEVSAVKGDVNSVKAEVKAEVEAVKGEVSALKGEVEKLAGLKAEVEAVKGSVAGVQTDLDKVEGNVEDLVDYAAKAESTLESVAAKGCGKNATALVLEIAAAAALLAFVLRKRH